MTESQAQEIAEILKSGKQYKRGHYQYGYMYFWYNEYDKSFRYKMEDLAMNIYEPEITEETLTEVEFLKKLIKDYTYGEMINYMI